MTRTSSLEVSIKTHNWCILNIIHHHSNVMASRSSGTVARTCQSPRSAFTNRSDYWYIIKLRKQDNRFIYVTCVIINNQLVLLRSSIQLYSISHRQGSTSNIWNIKAFSITAPAVWNSPVSRLQLRKVPLASPISRHIWQQAQLPQRNSASAASVYLGWLSDRAVHRTPQKGRFCTTRP